MTLSNLERRDARGQIFQVVLLNNARTVWKRRTEFSSITCIREELFLGGQPRPYRNWAVPQRSPILRFPSICAYTLWCKTTKYDVVTHVGRACILGSATPPEWSSRASSFGLFLYLYPHPLTQTDQIRRVETYWEGSATPLHLHKCVARFVSDSWVSCMWWL